MVALKAAWLSFLCAEAILWVAFSATVSFHLGSVRGWTFAEGFRLAQVVQSASGMIGAAGVDIVR